MTQLLATLTCLTALSFLGAVLLKLCIRLIAKESPPYKGILISFLFTCCVLILLSTLVNFTMTGVNKLLRSPDLYEIVETTKHVLKPLLLIAGLTFFSADKAHIPVSRSFFSVLLFFPLFVPTLVFVVSVTSKAFGIHPVQLIPQFMI